MSLKDEAKTIIESTGIGMTATCDGGVPRCRPMTFRVTEDFKLWSSTYRSSGKVGEFEKNPRVEICFTGPGKVHLRVEGTVDLSGGPEKKEKLLEMNPGVRNHFHGGADPKFVHVEVTPSRMRWMPPGFGEYTVLEL